MQLARPTPQRSVRRGSQFEGGQHVVAQVKPATVSTADSGVELAGPYLATGVERASDLLSKVGEHLPPSSPRFAQRMGPQERHRKNLLLLSSDKSLADGHLNDLTTPVGNSRSSLSSSGWSGFVGRGRTDQPRRTKGVGAASPTTSPGVVR